MKYSKGIMWLDDCRIPFVDDYGDKKGNDNKKRSGYVYGFSTYESLYVRAEPNQQGRFTPNLLVCDDILNDGNVSKAREKYPDKNLLPMDYYDGLKKPYPTDYKQTKEGFTDKGTNSRYYDLDLWFDKMLEKL